MKVASINVGMPQYVPAGDRRVLTAIVKTPVTGPVAVTWMNLEGDRQADLRVHGGAQKAVYAYPHEHYAFWRGELPDADLDPGAFGENLTTEGVLETDIAAGDILEIGAAAFRVTIPRLPCFKLAIRFGRGDMIKRFLRSGRCGFYLAVAREGQIAPGDDIRLTQVGGPRQTIAEVFAARASR